MSEQGSFDGNILDNFINDTTSEFSTASRGKFGDDVIILVLLAIALLTVVALVIMIILKLKASIKQKHKIPMSESSSGGVASDANDVDIDSIRGSDCLTTPYPRPSRSSSSSYRTSNRTSYTIQEDEVGYCVPNVPNYLDEFPRNYLYIRGLLGEGQFGYVLKAQYRPPPNRNDKDNFPICPMKVAIKCPKVNGKDNKDELHKQFILEAKKMKRLNHPNVLSVIGLSSVNYSGDLPCSLRRKKHGNLQEILDRIKSAPMAVLPYLSKGDLKNHLFSVRKDNRHISTPLKILLKYAWDISNGMAYLTEKGVLHRDLAARNCLLDDNGNVLVSDFGLSKNLYYNRTFYIGSGAMMPVKWMAIESLEDNLYSEKSDVWSFGVTLWEILSFCITPYPGVSGSEITGYLRSGARLSKPVIATQDVWKVVTSCWRENPKERPKFSTLKNDVRSLYKKYNSIKKKSKEMELEMIPEPPPRTKSLLNLNIIRSSADLSRMQRSSDGTSIYIPTQNQHSLSTMELYSPLI